MAGLKADQDVQRAAMTKLAFLIGKWEGEMRVYRGPGEPVALTMTEDASWRLDGLILLIEGVGRTEADGKPVLQAFGFISYDDARAAYVMRAFNDGRFVESEVKLIEPTHPSSRDAGTKDGAPNPQLTLTWGFGVEHVRTSSVLRINEMGEWTELHEITIGDQPAKKFMELTVRRVG